MYEKIFIVYGKILNHAWKNICFLELTHFVRLDGYLLSPTETVSCSGQDLCARQHLGWVIININSIAMYIFFTHE